MEIGIIKREKNEIELNVDNLTVAEILRVYLNEQGIKFAAWKKSHPPKPAIFRIESSGKTVGKAISDAVVAIKKDCDAVVRELKK